MLLTILALQQDDTIFLLLSNHHIQSHTFQLHNNHLILFVHLDVHHQQPFLNNVCWKEEEEEKRKQRIQRDICVRKVCESTRSQNERKEKCYSYSRTQYIFEIERNQKEKKKNKLTMLSGQHCHHQQQDLHVQLHTFYQDLKQP